MELIVGVNSYVTIDEVKILADDYIIESDKLTWLGTLSDNDISKLINISTKKIDNIPFKGKKLAVDQKLQFPRLVCNKQVDIPDNIKIAIVLQAVEDGYSVNDEELQLKDKGVTKYSVDGASIEFGSGTTGKDKLSCGVSVSIYSQYLKQYSTLII